MKRIHGVAILLLVLLACPKAFGQDSGWAFVVKAGTQGAGVDLHRRLVGKALNFRAGASFFQYSYDFDDDGISYDGQLRLGAVPVLLDVYPFKNWFRLSAGLEWNLNRAMATAIPYQGQITLNHQSYSANQIGTLKGAFKFDRVSPLVGIGFSNPIKPGRHWGATLDIGGIYHGTPKFPMTITGPLSGQLATDLRAQQADVEKDVAKYKFYPILQFGISYHFGSK